jgi:hypothetical protein
VDRPAEPTQIWERCSGDARAPLSRDRRREPEKTLLHALVRENLEPFLAAARERSPSGRGFPAHVERDLRAYLDCGMVPVRQWVLSLPRRLRFRAARDPRLVSRLLDVFTRALFAWLRRRARALGVADPRTGGVTAVQRFGGAVNLNVHFHTDEATAGRVALPGAHARIASLVPPPRSHAVRYHGVFAPNAKHRSRVVPAAGRGEPAPASPDPGPLAEPVPPLATPLAPPAAGPAGTFQLTPPEPPPERPSPRYRVPWAELLRKVFGIDVLECPECAGRLEVIAFIAEPTVARRILDHLGMDAQAPPLARAWANDEDPDPGPDYAAGDPVHED